MAEYSELLSKANLFLKSGNIDDSIEIFTMLMERYPDKPLIFYNMGLAFIEKENFELAEKVFNHCLNLGYKDKRVYLGLGFSCLKREEFDMAISNFDKSLEEDEDFPEAIIGKIYSLVKSGKTGNTKELLNKLKSIGVWNQELELISKTLKLMYPASG